MTYANIIVETHGAVGLIRLNRPHALNALSSALIEDLNVGARRPSRPTPPSARSC